MLHLRSNLHPSCVSKDAESATRPRLPLANLRAKLWCWAVFVDIFYDRCLLQFHHHKFRQFSFPKASSVSFLLFTAAWTCLLVAEPFVSYIMLNEKIATSTTIRGEISILNHIQYRFYDGPTVIDIIFHRQIPLHLMNKFSYQSWTWRQKKMLSIWW